MDAVVLAGGEGSRMRPLAGDMPKHLVDIDHTPLLSHCLDSIVSLAIDELVIVVGSENSALIDHFGTSFDGVPITYAHQSEPKGLADALLAAEELIEDEFVLTYGDVIFQTNLERCLEIHRETSPDATILVMDLPYSEAIESGVCVPDQTGEVVGVIEKPADPPSTLCLPGFFVFDQVIFSACKAVEPSARGEYELLDAIDRLISAGRAIEWYEASGWQINVNTPDDVRMAEQKLAER